MKKAKLSDSELKLLVILLSLALIAASYFFVFTSGMEQAEAIEAENLANQTEITRLQGMVARRVQVEENTVELNSEVDDIIARYPSDVTEEKAIVIVQDIEDISGMHVSSIGFLMDNLVSLDTVVDTAAVAADASTAAADTAAADAAATDSTAVPAASAVPVYTNESMGYYAELTIDYSAGYDAFKEMVTYINGLEDRMTIPSVSGSYDSSNGQISGKVTFDLYYLTNTGKEYEEPELDRVQDGVSNIFGSRAASKNRR